jgi:hypothetical protein
MAIVVVCHAVALVIILLHVLVALLCACPHATIDLQFYATSLLHGRSDIMLNFISLNIVPNKVNFLVTLGDEDRTLMKFS